MGVLPCPRARGRFDAILIAGVGVEELEAHQDTPALAVERLFDRPRAALEELFGVERDALIEPRPPEITARVPGFPHQHAVAGAGALGDRGESHRLATHERVFDRDAEVVIHRAQDSSEAGPAYDGSGMALHIVRLGSPRAPGEGLRIGTVRRPPRGVPKSEFARRDYYDVWLPQLAPSAELVALALAATDGPSWQRFTRSYRAEMKDGDASRLLDLLAALSRRTDLAVGCYCEDETRCHRSVLRELLAERGADIA